jgi:hypothetical protein
VAFAWKQPDRQLGGLFVRGAWVTWLEIHCWTRSPKTSPWQEAVITRYAGEVQRSMRPTRERARRGISWAIEECASAISAPSRGDAKGGQTECYVNTTAVASSKEGGAFCHTP